MTVADRDTVTVGASVTATLPVATPALCSAARREPVAEEDDDAPAADMIPADTASARALAPVDARTATENGTATPESSTDRLRPLASGAVTPPTAAGCPTVIVEAGTPSDSARPLLNALTAAVVKATVPTSVNVMPEAAGKGEDVRV
jgi:hypothetical protein